MEKEIVGIPSPKGNDGQVMVKLDDKLKELEDYSNNLLNVEHRWDGNLIYVHLDFFKKMSRKL